MAFYEKAARKKGPVNYGDLGSWDEEGTHYRGAEPKGGKGGKGGPRSGSRRGEDGSARFGKKQDPRWERKPSGKEPARRFGPVRGPETQAFRGDGKPYGKEPARRFGPGRGLETQAPRGDGKSYGKEPDHRFGPGRGPETSVQIEKEYRKYEYHPPEKERFAPPEEENDHILCGRNPIREALRSGREIEKLLVQKGELSGSAREIVMEAREKKIMVQEVDKRRLDEIALHHQGLVAFAAPYHYADLDEILAEAEKKQEMPFLILLDGVTDPHNLGAVIRTAECAGAHGVIIPVYRSVGMTPAAVKASAGALEHIKVAKVTNLNRVIDDLKRRGVWTYAVTMNGKDYEKVDFRGGCALVIGAEGEGLSRLTAEKCDLSVSLPLKGKIDSLNASVAAGIMMYRVLSCRRKA